MKTAKLDLTKKYKIYYTAKTSPEVVEFGEARFLAIEGKGEPGGKEFTSKIEALYPLAYGVKNHCKKQGKDFVVPKLEGLWWVDSDRPFQEVPREEWRWKLLIRMPNFVTSEMVERAKEEVFKKKDIELVKEIKFEEIAEGKCVQIMHIGPYSAEGPAIEKLHSFAEENRYELRGKHHEIYLTDPRKMAPEKMKTVLRHPVEKK